MARSFLSLPPELILAIASHLDPQELRLLILSSRRTALVASSLLIRNGYFTLHFEYRPSKLYLRGHGYWEALIRAWDGEHLLYPFERLSEKLVNTSDPNGNTLLHLVASVGNVELTRILLKRGAKANSPNHDCWTQLMNASEQGHVDVARLLLAAGADPIAFGRRSPWDWATPLCLSVPSGSAALIQLILDAIKASDTEHPLAIKQHVQSAKHRRVDCGETPLERAARNGDLSMLRFLISTDLVHGGPEFIELLAIASSRGRVACCEFLIQLIRSSRTDDITDWATPAASSAILSRELEVFKLFVDYGLRFVPIDGGRCGENLLRTAMRYGQKLVIDIMLEACPHLWHSKDMQSCLWPDTSRYKATTSENDVRRLLEASPCEPTPPWELSKEVRRIHTILDLVRDSKIQINISAPSAWQGFTCLHYAALSHRFGHTHLQRLLDAGADPRSQTIHGDTPLNVAVRSGDALLSISKTLLEVAPDTLTHKNTSGQTLLHSAVTAENEPVIETVAFLLAAGVDPRSQTIHGDTPLHFAARSGDALLTISKTLLDAAPDTITYKNTSGQSPLHSALTRDNELMIETVSFLLAAGAGAGISSPDDRGHTPLHTAVLHNSGREPRKKWKVMNLLIEAGASVSAVDNEGATPAHLAVVGRQSLSFWKRYADEDFLRGHCGVCRRAFGLISRKKNRR